MSALPSVLLKATRQPGRYAIGLRGSKYPLHFSKATADVDDFFTLEDAFGPLPHDVTAVQVRLSDIVWCAEAVS